MIAFHGGCHGCTMQEIHGVDNCIKCRYFAAEWHKKDLNNRPPTEAELERKRIQKAAKGPLMRLIT